MTDRDDLRDRLDAVADAVGRGPLTAGDVPPRERSAIRAALRHRYTAGGDLVGDPFGDLDARRAFLADAADHVDDEHATVLRGLLPTGEVET